jgi:Glycosyl transferase family 11
MFQYAIGRRLAYKRGVPLKLDLSAYDDPQSRPYDLHHLNIDAERATYQELDALARRKPFYRKKTLIRERHFHYEPRIAWKLPPVYLRGWWQSERYFADIREVLLDEFQVVDPPDQTNAGMIQEISAAESSVAMHIRRGDYLQTSYYASQPLTYYEQAAGHLVKETKDAHFYIFSDDPEWVQQNLKLAYPCTYVTHNDSAKNYEDLRLMSLCRHFVTANSSFSWWGAWLANRPGKIVFAPQKWFSDESINTADLVPTSWRRL